MPLFSRDLFVSIRHYPSRIGLPCPLNPKFQQKLPTEKGFLCGLLFASCIPFRHGVTNTQSLGIICINQVFWHLRAIASALQHWPASIQSPFHCISDLPKNAVIHFHFLFIHLSLSINISLFLPHSHTRIHFLQENGLAPGAASGHRSGVVQFLHGTALPAGLTLSSATACDTTLEKPKEKGKSHTHTPLNPPTTRTRALCRLLLYSQYPIPR